MIKEMVCIVCPMSCHLSVEIEDGRVMSVTGNTCPRGAKYASEEICNPTRMVTSTVTLKNAKIARLPVATDKPIPKNKIFEVMEHINRVSVKAPVKLGDIIISNVAKTGANIIATRSFESII